MVKTPPVKFYSIKSLILRYRKYIRLPAGCDCITLKMPVCISFWGTVSNCLKCST